MFSHFLQKVSCNTVVNKDNLGPNLSKEKPSDMPLSPGTANVDPSGSRVSVLSFSLQTDKSSTLSEADEDSAFCGDENEDEDEISGSMSTSDGTHGSTCDTQSSDTETTSIGERRPTNPDLESLRQEFLRNRSNSTESDRDGEMYSRQASHLDSIPLGRRLNDIQPKSSVSYHRNLKDVFCDPERPRTLQFQHVSYASFKIREGIVKTPCTWSNMSKQFGMDLFFKKEFLQATGSFKERGARNTLMKLLPDQKKLGVIAASAGNHALALAYHGQDLGIPVTVVMPIVAPLMKVSLCRQYGANVLILGNHIGESKEFAMRMADEQNLTYVNGYDHLDILAGAGTIGLEILDQVKDVDAIVVPVGGGGLIAGIAVAVKYLQPNVLIIGAEADKCAGMKTSLEKGKPTYVMPESTLADGLSVPIVGVNSFATSKGLIDKMVTVREKDIARAILRLIEIEKAVVEGAGAVGLAAVLSGKLEFLKGKRVVIPLCGGNIDTTVLGRAIERGLACEGRLIRISVTVSDRPGGIAELAGIFAKAGASIKDIFHERAFMCLDIFAVRVILMVETRGREHAQELMDTLRSHYSDVVLLMEETD